MKTWKTLIRREFWEHRGMWIVPLAFAGLLIAVTLFAAVTLRVKGPEFAFEHGRPGGLQVWYGTTFAVAALLFFLVGMSLFGYLLDALYSERKDRSILFWRSLPVSDRDTVLSKYAMAVLVLPVFAWVIAVVTHLVCSGILMLLAPEAIRPIAEVWSVGGWLKANAMLAYLLVVAVLWYAPVAAWLLLASAFAKRSPFMYAFAPVAALLAAERLVLGTDHATRFVLQRLSLPFGSSSRRSFEHMDPGAVFVSPELWLGVVAAAAMVTVAIRLRRYRDDT